MKNWARNLSMKDTRIQHQEMGGSSLFNRQIPGNSNITKMTSATMAHNRDTSPYGRRLKSNELDLLLEDLSHARYNGGPPEIREEHHSEEHYSSSIVQRLNGYHPESQIVEPIQKSSRRREESSTMTTQEEEETIIEEETKKYQFHLKDGWEERDKKKRKPLTQTTTVYATISPPPSASTTTSYHVEETTHIDELTQTLEWSKLRQVPVDMPVNTNVPEIMEKIHEEFEKPGIREKGPLDASLRKRLMEEMGQVEVEETTWVMPEVPEPPKRPEPICAACTKSISGRCITAMMRKFHPEHFVCSYCLKQLNKGTFKESEDKPYCQDCFYRLYG